MTTETGAAPDAASDKLAGEAAKADAGMARLQEALRRFAGLPAETEAETGVRSGRAVPPREINAAAG